MTMLKFEALANIGDVIRAYDFKPMEGRPVCYMTGRVIAKGPVKHPELGVVMFHGYTIEIIDADEDTRESRIGDTGYVPFEVDFMEYDNRVKVIATAEDMDEMNHIVNVLEA